MASVHDPWPTTDASDPLCRTECIRCTDCDAPLDLPHYSSQQGGSRGTGGVEHGESKMPEGGMRHHDISPFGTSLPSSMSTVPSYLGGPDLGAPPGLISSSLPVGPRPPDLCLAISGPDHIGLSLTHCPVPSLFRSRSLLPSARD